MEKSSTQIYSHIVVILLLSVFSQNLQASTSVGYPSITSNSDGSFDVTFPGASCTQVQTGTTVDGRPLYDFCALQIGYGQSDTNPYSSIYTNVYDQTVTTAASGSTLRYNGGTVHVSQTYTKPYFCATESANDSSDISNQGTTYKRCVPVAPPVSCSATDTTIEFDGLTPTTFAGSTKSSNTNITCTGDADVRIIVTNPNISLSNGGQALISSNYGAQQSTLHIQGGTSSSAALTAVLSGTVSPGSFQGSTSMTIDIQ